MVFISILILTILTFISLFIFYFFIITSLVSLFLHKLWMITGYCQDNSSVFRQLKSQAYPLIFFNISTFYHILQNKSSNLTVFLHWKINKSFVDNVDNLVHNYFLLKIKHILLLITSDSVHSKYFPLLSYDFIRYLFCAFCILFRIFIV